MPSIIFFSVKIIFVRRRLFSRPLQIGFFLFFLNMAERSKLPESLQIINARKRCKVRRILL